MSIQTKKMIVKSDTSLAETSTTIRDIVTFDVSNMPNGITYKGLKAVLSFADPIQWNKASTYDALTVVWDDASHGSYASKRPVPANIELDNDFYWLRTADLDAQVEIYRQEVREMDGRVTANAQAIAAETTRAEGAEHTLQANIDALDTKVTKNVYVESFGAVGDGVTDDTDAIQSAFDYAAKYNRPIVFKPGRTYLVNPTKNKVATNGGYKIEYSYCAIAVRGNNVVVNGNGATIKGVITQAQYDSNDETVGAVLLLCSTLQDTSKIGQNNDSEYLEYGMHVVINNLIIDGGGENIVKTARSWSRGSDNLPKARGISNINQYYLSLTTNNVSIMHTAAEGMSGGDAYDAVFINGGYFRDCFPSPLNLSGGIEVIDGCVVDNPMVVEMNPSYKNGSQVVRNCTFKSTIDTADNTYVFGCVGLLSEISSDNANIEIYNNVFDIVFNEQPKQSTFIFYKLNTLRFHDNTVNIKANSSMNSGYGDIFTTGNGIGEFNFYNNVFNVDYVSGYKSMSLFDNSNSTFTRKFVSSNKYIFSNLVDISGTNLLLTGDLRPIDNASFTYKIHVPTGSTTLAYRIGYLDKVNAVKIKASKPVTISGFDISGFANDGSFKSLLPSGKAASYSIPVNGRLELLAQVTPHVNGESITITADTPTDTDFDLELTFLTDINA